MSPYLICAFLLFVWRHRWRHRWSHKDPFGSSAFFVDSFRSNWDKDSRKGPLCWHSTSESTEMWLNPLAQSMTWGGWLDLDLGVNLDFDLCQTKSILLIWCGLIRRLRWCLNVGSRVFFLAQLWTKKQTPTFGSLTWPLRSPVDFRPWIWVPVAVSLKGRHVRFFCEAPVQLEVKRLGGRTVWRWLIWHIVWIFERNPSDFVFAVLKMTPLKGKSSP